MKLGVRDGGSTTAIANAAWETKRQRGYSQSKDSYARGIRTKRMTGVIHNNNATQAWKTKRASGDAASIAKKTWETRRANGTALNVGQGGTADGARRGHATRRLNAISSICSILILGGYN